MADAKKDSINVSWSPLDDAIIKHLKAFQKGVTTSMAEAWKPIEMKLKNYEISIKSVCNKVMKQVRAVRQYVYQLKEEMVKIYESMLDENVEKKEQQKNRGGIDRFIHESMVEEM
ncbi:MAG: hypothetical protein EZS28_002899 [Streblomastix strix]|uniref:Uncharacterized protein n=1 Tax=Streblomastix strix TaxID=222440 RepID=A0A5J4X2L1_9EUKA|nr:MAG: hypothetical protein EZS28_002896 [Streblomastix strix]KAA6401577.1 MAG: hypothetical protein EZS28_002899 [Streblomastix strix]